MNVLRKLRGSSDPIIDKQVLYLLIGFMAAVIILYFVLTKYNIVFSWVGFGGK